MNTKQFEIIEVKLENYEWRFKWSQTSCFIDDKVHIFGYFIEDDDIMEHGYFYQNLHAIYDLKTNLLIYEPILELKDYIYDHENGYRLGEHSMVFLRSSRRILFTGGCIKSHILSLDIDENKYSLIRSDKGRYGLHPYFIVSRDEKYVIRCNHQSMDIFDVEENIFIKQDINLSMDDIDRDADFIGFVSDGADISDKLITGYLK